MSAVRSLSSAAKLNATFLFVAVVGIIIQIASGVPGYPKVPPGPIILGVVGILVLALTTRFKWILILGIIAPAFILFGGIVEGSSWGRLGHPGNFGPFLGTALQMIGIVVALIYGIIATTEAFKKAPAH
jgi:hypothetical protein